MLKLACTPCGRNKGYNRHRVATLLARYYWPLGGAIILNIMLNMTRISEVLEHKERVVESSTKTNKTVSIAIAISFPLIVRLLFLGDYRSSIKKNHLIDTAKFLTLEHEKSIDILSNYSFSTEYIEKSSDILIVLSKVEKKFPNIKVIVPDVIESKSVLLAFSSQNRNFSEIKYKKREFTFSSSKEEPEYLMSVFNKNNSSIKFSAHDGCYELHFPIETKSGTIVMYLSANQRYGKLGS